MAIPPSVLRPGTQANRGTALVEPHPKEQIRALLAQIDLQIGAGTPVVLVRRRFDQCAAPSQRGQNVVFHCFAPPLRNSCQRTGIGFQVIPVNTAVGHSMPSTIGEHLVEDHRLLVVPPFRGDLEFGDISGHLLNPLHVEAVFLCPALGQVVSPKKFGKRRGARPDDRPIALVGQTPEVGEQEGHMARRGMTLDLYSLHIADHSLDLGCGFIVGRRRVQGISQQSRQFTRAARPLL